MSILITKSELAAADGGQLPGGGVDAPYSLNTRSDGEPSTRNTVVSGPTKTSA
jgi:hypothetical protein